MKRPEGLGTIMAVLIIHGSVIAPEELGQMTARIRLSPAMQSSENAAPQLAAFSFSAHCVWRIYVSSDFRGRRPVGAATTSRGMWCQLRISLIESIAT